MRLPVASLLAAVFASLCLIVPRADAAVQDCSTGNEHCHDAHYSPGVAVLGKDFFVGWVDYSHHRESDIQGRLVTVDGGANAGGGFGLGEVISLTQVDQPPPVEAETAYFFVWEKLTSADGADLRAALVCRDGLTVRVTQIPVAADAGSQRRPGVAAVGVTRLVTWVLDGGAAIRGRRVGVLGDVLDDTAISIAETTLDSDSYPSAAANGQDFLVVWDAPSPTGRDIRVARVKLDGTVLDPDGVVVWSSPGSISRPEVRSNGTHYLIAWRESSSVGQGVRALRVDANLAVLDPSSILLGSGAGATPDVATNGADWLVAWDQSGSIQARRVGRDGTLPDAQPLQLAAGPGNELPDGNSNGDLYVVAWTNEREPGWYNLRATRITNDGLVLDPDGTALTEADDHSGAIVCAIGPPGAAHRRAPLLVLGTVLTFLLFRTNHWGFRDRGNRSASERPIVPSKKLES